MSRKHFRAIAEAISKIENESERRAEASRMADVCQQSNPRFNRGLFLQACGC